MEVMEGFKEGYESSADPDEGLGENSEDDEEEEEEEESEEEEEQNDSNSDR
jgi:hypothetical protein